VTLANQMLVDEYASGLRTPEDWRVTAKTEQAWLASRKITDSLFLAPVKQSPLLDLSRVAGDHENVAVRAAALTAAFLLVYRAALELDVDPSEFEILPPRVSKIDGEVWPVLQIADTLVNGSGLSRRLSQPAGRPWAIELLESIVDDTSAWPLRDFLADKHRSYCDQACYECLQRYGNRNYHGLLDWRLGLAFARALLDPTYAAGSDGRFEAPELLDWRSLVEGALVRVARGAKDLKVLHDAPLPAIQLRRPEGDLLIAVRHPLWRQISPLMEAMRKEGGTAPLWIDSFELARRPFSVIARITS